MARAHDVNEPHHIIGRTVLAIVLLSTTIIIIIVVIINIIIIYLFIIYYIIYKAMPTQTAAYIGIG